MRTSAHISPIGKEAFDRPPRTTPDAHARRKVDPVFLLSEDAADDVPTAFSS
jgi:hypothetical protein